MARADKNSITEYLLGRLTDAEDEQVELRLLTDPEFAEEYDIVVNEVVDDYVAGKFEGEELKRVEEYFFKSPERKKKLKFALALKERKSEMLTIKGHKQKTFRPYLAIAASVLLVIGGFFIWRALSSRSEVDKGLAALQSAFREERPLESRISGFNHAPFISRRAPGEEKFDKNDLSLAELTLRREVEDRPSPAANYALGKVFLAKKDFEGAIKEFEEALKDDSKNAQIYSDLGAAWLEKGRIDLTSNELGKGTQELGRSLENLNKALELKPTLLEALFNRGLVHQEMILPEQAAEDWRSYLQQDNNSKWADDAREKLRLLELQKQKTSQTRENLLNEFLRNYDTRDDAAAWRVISVSREALSRKLIWEQLLDRYLESCAADRVADARNDLKALVYEGELENRRADDRYVNDLARFYQASSERQHPDLIQARELMKQGHQYYFKNELHKASEAYTSAHRMFAALGDEPESLYALHWIAYCDYELGKTHEALSALQNLATALQAKKYQWLLMRTLHIASSACQNLDESSKAINYNRRALSLAEQIDDRIGVLNASSVLIFQYGSTGNHTQALEYVRRSLSVINSCPLNEIQSTRHYSTVALAFHDAGLYYAAIDYEKEALRRAVQINHAQHMSVDYARLGVMYGKLGKFEEALRNLDLAYAAAKSCPDEATRKDLMSFSSLQTGHLYREQSQFAKAIRSYDQSIALADASRFQFDAYEAHKNKLFCYLALHDDSSTADELKITLGLTEKYRSKIVEGDNRNSFFDLQQTVYDLAIDFTYSRQADPETAFQYSEDSRARSLLDSVTERVRISEKQTPDISFESVTQSLKLSEIRQRLPGNVQVLQYAVLNDKVLIWVVSKTQFTAVHKTISQRELEKLVNDYLRFAASPASPPEDLKNRAKALFEILIGPVEPFLDPGKTVYLVPDKFLNALPVGTLISPATGRFVIEDYLLQISPSSSLLVILSKIAEKKDGPQVERLLSVGNPRFDRNDFPTLADLPSAAREAEDVASYYSSSLVLTDRNATHQHVSSEMPNAEVLHFALHSVANEQFPMQSRLVLAKDSAATEGTRDSDGSLQAHEIYELKLPRTRLALLSACHTGAERYYGGEGMISLARPFLAARVPLVLVSLWSVDSNPTADLMISFHKYRKDENLSSVEALRRAQLEMLKRPEEHLQHPFYWGAFELIGGVANF